MLPPPAFDPEVVKFLNDPAYEAAFSRKFFSGIEEFLSVVHEKLNPRTSNNDAEYATGEALAVLLDQYVNTLNTPGAVLNVQLAWQAFIQEKYSQAMMNVGKLNEQGIAEIRSKVPCKAGIIQDQHYQVVETCLQLFHSETEGIYVKSTDEHPNMLVTELNESFCKLLKENEQATQKLCEDLLQKLKQDILDPVLGRLSGPEGAKMSYQDIMQSYSALEAAYKQQAKGAEDICAAVLAKFRPHLQTIVQSYRHLLKKLKDSDVRITEEKEAKAREEAVKKLLEGEKELLQNKLQRKEKEFESQEYKREEERKRLSDFYKTRMENQRAHYEAIVEKMEKEKDAMRKRYDQALAKIDELKSKKNSPVAKRSSGVHCQSGGRALTKICERSRSPVKPNHELNCRTPETTVALSPVLSGQERHTPPATFKKEKASAVPTRTVLTNLSREIICVWKSLGLRLEVDQWQIENIMRNNEYPEPVQKAFQVLKIWRDKGSTSTYTQLAQALREEGLDRLAEEYC